MILSNRQWHQCKAALVFWQAVAGSSRVHPTQHPRVRGMFGDDRPSPLTDAEIREVLAMPFTQDRVGHTIKAFAAAMGIPAGPLAYRLRYLEPASKVGNTRTFLVADLRRAAKEIRPRERKNYAIPAVQPET